MKRLSIIFLFISVLFLFSACGHEHVFGEWITVKEATCTEEGVKERSCECGEKETEQIPMIDHEYKEKVTQKKTCTKDGKIVKTCTVCGHKEESIDKATGHDYAAATVFTPKTCKICGKTKGSPLSQAVKIGSEETVEGKHSFTVDSDFFTSDLKERRGNTTYYGSFKGKYVYAIKLNFKNLSTEDFESYGSNRIKDIKLQYKGEYNYEGEYWCPVDDIVPLKNDIIYLVFEVPEELSNDKENSILIAFTIDDVVYSFVKQKGTTNPTDENKDNKDNKESSSTDKENIKIGKEYSDGKNHSFVFEDLYYTSKLSAKSGSTTYTFGNDGYYLVLKIKLKNLQTENFEQSYSDRMSDIKLSYDKQYNYEGEYRFPIDDIVPLGTGEAYIYFNVPNEVETGDGELIASFKIDGKTYTVDCRTVK